MYNAEPSLSGKVHRLLEVLPDLTPRFEILVVDGGSSDNSREMADELARTFPQVRVTTHPGRLDERDLIEIGMAETAGEVLFILGQDAAIDSSKLARLWELKDEESLILSQPEFQGDESMLRGLAAVGFRLEDPRRHALGGADGPASAAGLDSRTGRRSSVPSALRAHGFPGQLAGGGAIAPSGSARPAPPSLAAFLTGRALAALTGRRPAPSI
jgi:glycosyltransferase involved in cell wall biosynthesis